MTSGVKAPVPTERQLFVLRTIKRWVAEHGHPPTIREPGTELGIRSTNGVRDHLLCLERHGLIKRETMKSRMMKPTDASEREITQESFFKRWEYEKARFWEHVDKTGDCWLWTGRFCNGLGSFSGTSVEGVPHRVAWEITNGPLGPRELIRVCPTDACVRPAHHRLGRREKALEQPRTLYFFQMGADGPIKIGIARSVPRRFAMLETASPYPIRILHAEPGTMRDEKALHKRFAACRIRREWFSPSPELLEFITSRTRATAAA